MPCDYLLIKAFLNQVLIRSKQALPTGPPPLPNRRQPGSLPADGRGLLFLFFAASTVALPILVADGGIKRA